jgi:pre-mRNA-processing factor 39
MLFLVSFQDLIPAAREAYDGFLSRYPYCYGYWKKYADYEKRKGSPVECEQVIELPPRKLNAEKVHTS